MWFWPVICPHTSCYHKLCWELDHSVNSPFVAFSLGILKEKIKADQCWGGKDTRILHPKKHPSSQKNILQKSTKRPQKDPEPLTSAKCDGCHTYVYRHQLAPVIWDEQKSGVLFMKTNTWMVKKKLMRCDFGQSSAHTLPVITSFVENLIIL